MLKVWKKIYQKSGVKPKCSIDKKAILYKILFFVTLPIKILLLESIFTYFQLHLKWNCLDKPVLNNVSRLNHSSPMNKTGINKIKHFSQLFALGSQIPLKRNLHHFFP